ncbi:hypothetical protein EON80_00505 [bacterium]|nr:MAG: hypothetical protein EON80_00505 [bacterium]
MASLNSHRSLLGLFALSTLICGSFFAVARFAAKPQTVAQSDLVWKSGGSAQEVAFSSDGRTVIALSDKCETFDATTGKLISSWRVPGNGHLTPNGKFLIYLDSGTAAPPFTVSDWRRKSGSLSVSRGLDIVRNPNSDEVKLLTRKGRSLVAHDTRTGIVSWKKEIPARSELYRISGDDLCAVSDRHIWVQTTFGNNVPQLKNNLRVFSAQNGQLLRSFPAPQIMRPGWGNSFVFDKTGAPLYKKQGWSSAADPRTTDALELRGETPPRRFKLARQQAGYDQDEWSPLSFDKRFRRLVGIRKTPIMNSDTSDILVWEAGGKLLFHQEQEHFKANAASFSPDARFLAVGGRDLKSLAKETDGRLLVYDIASGKIVKDLREATWTDMAKRPFTNYTKAPIPGFTGPVQHLSWSLNGRLLAAAYNNGGVRVWRVR